MSDSSKAELCKAEQLLYMGQYETALQIVETLEKREELISSDRITCQILKGTLLNKQGQFESALKLAERIFQEIQKTKMPLQVVDVLIIKIESLYHLGRGDESLELISQGEHLLEQLPKGQPSDIIQRQAALARYKGSIYSDKGNQDQALEFFNQSLAISKEFDNKRELALGLIGIGKVYWNNGELDQTLECLQQALALSEELGYRHDIARSLSNIGMIYQNKGDLERSMEYHQRALKILEKIGNKRDIAISLGEIGTVYADKGDFKRALEYDQQCLTLFEEIGNKRMIGLSLISVGNDYMQIGELEQALEYLEPSLTILEELDDKRSLTFSHLNIGLVYWKKGDLDQAFKSIEQSLTLREEIGNPFDITSSLLHIIYVTLGRSDSKKAHHYLQRLRKIDEQEKDDIIRKRYRLAEALVFKESPKAQHRAKAEKSLIQLAEEEGIVHELVVLALLHLCDMLLEEIDTSNTQEVLRKVRTYVNRLFEIAQQQKSPWLLASTYVFKAKVNFIEFQKLRTFEKIKELNAILQQIQNLAQEKQLFVILAQAHLLLALSYDSRMLFDEAKAEIQEAREIITKRNLFKENQKLEVISRQIQTSEATYLGLLEQSFEQGEQDLKLVTLEQEFFDSIDDYLQRAKAFLMP
ncbi:MAG: tetratricopeptide repeat protein [Candidatus Hermodarchaeota archaeon]